MSRYIVNKGSQSGHCCFEASVVDTTKPVIIGDEHYKDSEGQLEYEAICECMDEELANLICDRINK